MSTLEISEIAPPAVAETVARTLQPHATAPPAVKVAQAALRSPLNRLRAVLLLSGSLRPTEFQRALRRPLLDLPVDADRTIFDVWCDQVAELAASVRWSSPQIRVLSRWGTFAPTFRPRTRAPRVTIEPDREELRGTGGILRDAAADLDNDDYVLVAHAGQVLTQSLVRVAASITDAMTRTRASAGVLSHDDGTPTSLFMFRCDCLKLIRAVGFVDLKEQALPLIAARHRVVVCRRPAPIGEPVREAADYVAALQRFHRSARGLGQGGAFAEDLEPMFGVAEAGAVVEAGARLHDSVVLRGGHVGRGAVVVRSVIGAGATVPRDAVVVGQTLLP
jgi:hypothetical protein